MRKTKTEKGVTLIVLIITIVVLLILAAVAINNITNDGIISKTQNSAEKFNEVQLNKQEMLNEAFEELNGNGGSGVTKQIEIGAYVEYDVSYTDMYQGTTFNSTNGWRYLGTEAGTGNKLLISTGIPMILYYHYNTAGGNAKWWDTDTTLHPNVRATNGMINNFAKIPYAQKASGTSMSSGEENTAIGRFAGTEVTVDGTTYTAIGDAFKSSTYASNIENVRTLTLAELNRATNSARKGESGYTERAEDLTDAGFKDIPEGNAAYGLFDMKDLSGYTANYYYWLASPFASITSLVRLVSFDYGNVHFGNAYGGGVRPVVVLSSDVELKDTNGDGVYEIK